VLEFVDRKERFLMALENRQMAEDEYREQCKSARIPYECACQIEKRVRTGGSAVPAAARRVFG